jgi:hypothetical protein
MDAANVEDKKESNALQRKKTMKVQALGIDGSKIRQLLAEKIWQTNAKFWKDKAKEELRKLFPLVKEANTSAATLKRKFFFKVNTMREVNLNTN